MLTSGTGKVHAPGLVKLYAGDLAKERCPRATWAWLKTLNQPSHQTERKVVTLRNAVAFAKAHERELGPEMA